MKTWAFIAVLTLGSLAFVLLYVRTGTKIWASIAFLSFGALLFALTSVLIQRFFKEIGTGRPSNTLSATIGICTLSLSLIQYWILTGFFSPGSMLILAAVLLTQLAMLSVLGAISGIGLPERQSKIQVLTVIWGVQNTKEGCFYFSSSVVAVLISWIGSLWIFWSNPVGSDDVKIGVAIFMFVIPLIVMVPSHFAIQWPATTSPYLDDDVRNAAFIRSLAAIFRDTAYLLFPVWLFREEFNTKFPELPPFWLLLSVPILLFLVTGLIPFVVGAFRYRAQSNEILDWRKDWISDVIRIIQWLRVQFKVTRFRTSGASWRLSYRADMTRTRWSAFLPKYR